MRVVVTELKEKHLPALDDDFARGAYEDVDSLAALRHEITPGARESCSATG